MTARPAVAASLCALALVAGCGGSDDDGGADRSAPERVETTRVQVVEDLDEKGGFDAAEIYKRLSPGVVTILSLFEGGSSGPREGEGGQGSGFVLDGDGHLATNAHVVTTGEPPRLRRAKQVFVEFADGNRVPAKILGADANSDVALLKINPRGLTLTPLKLGSSSKLNVGAPVAAIGSPFGERQSLSVGIISAIDRNIQSLTAFGIGDAIQTDAAINRGNSGGPLLNARGRVIGINAQIRSSSGEGSGVGFAIPIDLARRALDQMRADGKVDYAFLGVQSQTLYPQLARKLGLATNSGALVIEAQEGGPAEKAKLEPGKRKLEFQGQPDVPVGGDAIVAVDGERIDGADELSELIAFKRPGEEVKLEVVRGKKRRTVTVKLAARPDRPPARPVR